MPIEMPKGLPFSVDTWSCSSRRKRHLFLTHAHKDHSVGISPNFSSPIYSTHITKTLLLQQSPQLSSLLFVSIEVGQRLVIDGPDGTFSVMAFDANHCPGAVMFLFEGEFGNILHTGDCRLTPDCLQCLPEKYTGKTGREPKLRLDYVFLDCTFGQSPIKIPSKYSAVQQVINCIWKHPDAPVVYLSCDLLVQEEILVINCIWKHPDAPVVYLSCDLLGQEEILVEVSRIFGSKIYVNRTDNAEFYQAVTVIAPDILSEDASLRFQVFTGFPKLYERAKAKMMEARANFQKEPLIIRPSTQWYACEESADIEMQRKQRFTEAHRDPFGVWHVCYSMHSSREELEWALQLLQPKRVVSTTPSCRAMELNYVKKQCFDSQIASDDPLWKLLDISTEVESSSPEKKSLSEIPVNVLSSSSHVEHSTTTVENKQLQPKVLSTSNVEHGLKLSHTIGRPPITLFGRARLGLQDSHFLLKEKENAPTKMDCPHISFIKNEKDESVLKQDDGLVEVNFESSEEKKSEVVESVSNSNTGSSKMFSQSLRKMYRSMNVPVPRPLPSLVELLNSTKRARRFQF